MSQDNVQLVRGLYDAFGKGDVPAVLGAMDPAIEWREAEGFIYAGGNPYIGPQAILQGVFMRLGSEWSDFAVNSEQVLDAGDQVVALGTYTGTYRATGKSVRAQFAHIWTVKASKIVRFQQYTDTHQFAAAVSAGAWSAASS